MQKTMMIAALALLAACSSETSNEIGEMPEALPSETAEPAPTPGASATPDDSISMDNATADADAPAQIPEPFRGEWNRVAADCGTARNDSRLRIEADRIRFHESSGQVTEVWGTDRTITVRAQLKGEGKTWTDSRNMTLSDDGQTLRSGGMTRVRCS
ncbi:MAG: hypothetical protein CVT76_01750 [Alphaproteobacteria bacterium HGW-Alphaproteobacteria-15]|nr:MAG: hypothetical protein CVT76_01750 [Alphaproteobacteria bacterium HGW-Alphaproteobacteria-15]